MEALMCWMDSKEPKGNNHLLQYDSRKVKVVVKEIAYRLNVTPLEQQPILRSFTLNDVVKVRIKTAEPVACELSKNYQPTLLPY
jgi:sulfate adenylyltransferase subunit 1